MSKYFVKEGFVLKAQKVHGNKYSYKKVVYVNSLTKVRIFCNSCQKYFQQTPSVHTNAKAGCPVCGQKSSNSKKFLSCDEFEKRAKKIHKGKYKYFQDYKHGRVKIKIKCSKHGVFKQLPYSHLQGKGCPKCGREIFSSDYKRFEEKASKIHDKKYSYFQDYQHNRKEVKMFCPEHGVFYQKPFRHLQGKGCIKCGNERITKTKWQFLEDAERIHGGVYDYSLVEYVNANTKIKSVCPKHGTFEQIPRSHLSGQGCPTCCTYKTELEVLNLASKVFRLKFLKVRLPELQGLELDAYNKSKKLAFEYNGEGHYLRCSGNGHFLKREVIKSAQKRDKKKRRLCKKLGIRLICVPYFEWKKLTTEKEKRKYLKDKQNV